jgi:hypothetical protein
MNDMHIELLILMGLTSAYIIYYNVKLKPLLDLAPKNKYAPEPWEMKSEDLENIIHESIVSFHDNIMFYLILISVEYSC